jgi:hypothetical protein
VIKEIRERYNAGFTKEKYQQFLKGIEDEVNKEILFRVAETPVFVPAVLKQRLIEAGKSIIDVVKRPDIKAITEGAIPDHLRVPNEDAHPLFLCVDFAICRDEQGELIPQLIEFQGFPSLFGWQALVADMFRKHFEIPKSFEFLIECEDHQAYLNLLSRAILAGHRKEEVVLLEIRPEIQKTNIDFYVIEKWLGVRPVCLSKIWAEGNQIFYDRDGVKTRIKRFYNRVIFDDLEKQEDFTPGVDLTQPWDVEWAEHPNWFFRLSKYSMPFLNSPFVPQTKFLSDFDSIPQDLDQWVLKPLFSFSGQGVIFDVSAADIEAIPAAERKDYIMQRKVVYEPVIQAPNGLVKCEIRLMYIWPPGDENPVLAANLTRLSKGVMIGVRYNEDHDWVGGTVSFLER